MPEQPKPQLANWLQDREVDTHIVIEPEDSVRDDWWRASCNLHSWYTTGHRHIVEEAASEHVADAHPPCAEPSERTFVGVPLYCDLLPDHDEDHANGGYIWPRAYKTPEMPVGDRCRCVISSCGWTFEVPRTPAIPPTTLAEVFGLGIVGMTALNNHWSKIEKELKSHLNTHTILEFATEIAEQRALNIGLAAQLSQMGGLLATEARAAVLAPRSPTTGIITGV